MFDDMQNARKIMSKLYGKFTVRIFRICHSVLHGELERTLRLHTSARYPEVKRNLGIS
jgi:hypothetical protein